MQNCELLNPEKTNGLSIYVELSYTDTGEEYTLYLFHDVLSVTKGIDDQPENLLTLDTFTHKKIITKRSKHYYKSCIELSKS